jgi:ComF family protein
MVFRTIFQGLSGRIAHAISASLLPATCCMCGFPGMRVGLDLCEYCVAMLPANTAVATGYPAIFSRVLVPYSYAYPVDRFVRALKFRGERLYARVLGVLLADAQRASGAQWPESLIPVPLHSSRYRERGFNQANEIARFTGRELGMHVNTGCLVRLIATREQSALSLVERRHNVRGAFLARAPCARHVALIDDVLTTGNTAAEAAHALAAAGVEKCELWAAARVLKYP